MSEQVPSSGRFPIWIVVGVVIGAAIGAFVIFGTGGSESPQSGPGDQAGVASPTPATQVETRLTVPEGGGTSQASLPSTASFEEWDAKIKGTDVDGYDELMRNAVAIEDPALRKQVVESLLLRWLDTDQGAFLEFLDDLEFGETEGREVWPSLIPAAAQVLPNVSEAAAGQPELDEIVQWMIDYYSEMDPAAAAEWARQWLLDESHDLALATVAGEMAVRSQEDAVALLGTIQNPDARLEAVMNIGATLAETDADAALAWAQALPNEEERDAAVEEVLWTMSETDPGAAAAKLAAAGDPSRLDAVSGSIAEEWAIQDSAKAIAWAESLPEGPAKNEAVQGALAGWAETDPRAAFAYYQSNHGANLETAEWIFDSWAFNNPAEAAAAVLQVQDPAMRERAIAGVVTGWLDEGSTEDVGRWVDSLPEGRQRDQASFAVVDMMSFDEPEPAWQRAMTIQEPDLREQALETAFSGLVDVNPATARAALEGAALAEEEKQRLRGLLDANAATIPGNQPAAVVAP